jgi:hypothetical protein
MKWLVARIKWIMLPVFAVLALPASLNAQKVVIKGATPTDVVRAVYNELGSQGFRLEDTTKSEGPVRSAPEREGMQRLLELVKTDLEARTP